MTPTSDAASRPIPPVDLAAERAFLGEALDAAIRRVVASGRYVSGEEVRAFEEAFAAASGVAHGIAVGSGTDALALGLRALGVGPGDEVLTTPFSFFATAGAIAWVGARPRFADVEPDTGLLDPTAVARALTPRTRVVLPVHLYGQMADMRAFADLAREKELHLLEDAAQAHGAHRDGVTPGQLGDLAAFSFYPTKNLGALGEGGLVLAGTAELADRLRRLRDHGMNTKYHHLELGTNSRMDELQAAVLRVKLAHLDAWNTRRREIAQRYDEALAGSPCEPLARPAGGGHAFHQYAVRVPDPPGRDHVLAALRAGGVAAGVHYPTPIHLQPAARPWGFGPGDFPAAERLASQVLCLPIHPFLQPADVDRVVALAGALG